MKIWSKSMLVGCLGFESDRRRAAFFPQVSKPSIVRTKDRGVDNARRDKKYPEGENYHTTHMTICTYIESDMILRGCSAN
mmetsp:Transcript_20909/g.43959  ORF Transcript_20909/g.43959 Transcript_20909/m.43959 type:complete len:80 (+) Transcript_20909:1645-1884(+)